MHHLKVQLEIHGVKSELTATRGLQEGSQEKQLALEGFLTPLPRNMLMFFQSQFLRFISMREACSEILASSMNTYLYKNDVILRKIFSF